MRFLMRHGRHRPSLPEWTQALKFTATSLVVIGLIMGAWMVLAMVSTSVFPPAPPPRAAAGPPPTRVIPDDLPLLPLEPPPAPAAVEPTPSPRAETVKTPAPKPPPASPVVVYVIPTPEPQPAAAPPDPEPIVLPSPEPTEPTKPPRGGHHTGRWEKAPHTPREDHGDDDPEPDRDHQACVIAAVCVDLGKRGS